MPSPEQPRGGQPDDTAPKGRESAPYYQASRYQNERPALAAYTRAQQVIYEHKAGVDLSAYRFLLNRLSHVAVVGEQPPEELEQQLTQILATGEPTTLPTAALKLLLERRALAQGISPWVEGHYRPGVKIYPDEQGKQ